MYLHRVNMSLKVLEYVFCMYKIPNLISGSSWPNQYYREQIESYQITKHKHLVIWSAL